ncbi:MAG: AarF/UbiB family protein [Patescibacteria group bacterium]
MSWLNFLKRFWAIGRIGARLLLERGVSREVRLRFFFERAGGAFLKLGQILSLRHDLISPRYANELLNLLSRVAVSPDAAMRQVFIEELGLSPELAFKTFDPVPIASASISQVYRAVLIDGAKVVVKIQRPGVRQVFELDFTLARFISGLLSFLRVFDSFQVQDVVEEFILWSRRELNFREELLNSQALGHFSESEPRTIIPRVYPEWSTARVLVSEDMVDVLSVEVVLEGLAHTPAEREELAYYFVFDIMRQYFIDGFFHADPHPANLFFTRDNRLGYFDFGLMGEVGTVRLDLLRIMEGMARRDLAFASKHFLYFGQALVSDKIDRFKEREPATYKRYAKVIGKVGEIMVDNLQADLEEILAPWYELRTVASEGPPTSSLVCSRLLLKLSDYQIHLPREIALFFRTLIIADIVAVRLAPDFDIIRALNNFFTAYPITVAEKLIREKTQAMEPEEVVDPTAHFSFEQLLELKEVEKEELGLAKEKLVNLIAAYAEDYEEIRQLLKA